MPLPPRVAPLHFPEYLKYKIAAYHTQWNRYLDSGTLTPTDSQHNSRKLIPLLVIFSSG